ncbi:unnamed protein product, partial [Ixodes hexagonus]
MKRCVVFSWWCCVCWCVAPSVLGYTGAQLSVEKGAKQRVQALLDHRPIPSFRSGASRQTVTPNRHAEPSRRPVTLDRQIEPSDWTPPTYPTH